VETRFSGVAAAAQPTGLSAALLSSFGNRRLGSNWDKQTSEQFSSPAWGGHFEGSYQPKASFQLTFIFLAKRCISCGDQARLPERLQMMEQAIESCSNGIAITDADRLQIIRLFMSIQRVLSGSPVIANS